MIKIILYLNILPLILARGGGHGGGHSSHSSHSHSSGHSHARSRFVRVVGTTFIADMLIIKHFQNTIKYNLYNEKDNTTIFNISYYRKFNISDQNYTCIYYEKSHIYDEDIILNMNILPYPGYDKKNLHKYCIKEYSNTNTNIGFNILCFWGIIAIFVWCSINLNPKMY